MCLRTEDFELYWLLSAGVHRGVKCSGFRLLNDYSVRAHPPVFNAVAVKLAVNRYVHLFAGATCAPLTRSHLPNRSTVIAWARGSVRRKSRNDDGNAREKGLTVGPKR